jgi:hypothetical protein
VHCCISSRLLCTSPRARCWPMGLLLHPARERGLRCFRFRKRLVSSIVRRLRDSILGIVCVVVFSVSAIIPLRLAGSLIVLERLQQRPSDYSTPPPQDSRSCIKHRARGIGDGRTWRKCCGYQHSRLQGFDGGLQRAWLGCAFVMLMLGQAV